MVKSYLLLLCVVLAVAACCWLIDWLIDWHHYQSSWKPGAAGGGTGGSGLSQWLASRVEYNVHDVDSAAMSYSIVCVQGTAERRTEMTCWCRLWRSQVVKPKVLSYRKQSLSHSLVSEDRGRRVSTANVVFITVRSTNCVPTATRTAHFCNLRQHYQTAGVVRRLCSIK